MDEASEILVSCYSRCCGLLAITLCKYVGAVPTYMFANIHAILSSVYWEISEKAGIPRTFTAHIWQYIWSEGRGEEIGKWRKSMENTSLLTIELSKSVVFERKTIIFARHDPRVMHTELFDFCATVVCHSGKSLWQMIFPIRIWMAYSNCRQRTWHVTCI